jgi:ribonucleoside-diphosphate reductase alpha chain
MISISCEHPDVEDFINLKSDLNICTKANISVRVTDEFMKAVRDDKYWVCSFHRPESDETIQKMYKAKDLFRLLAKRNWEMAEPGILYWDNITKYNLLDKHKDFEYAGTNPCAEEPLPAGGSCLLGSINLSEFVKKPFTLEAEIDWDSLIKTTRLAVRELNNVLNEGLELHPLQEQRDSVRDWRQIGLGIMGLADMLIKLNRSYDNVQGRQVAENVMRVISSTAIGESARLAEKYGCFPKCDIDALTASSFYKTLLPHLSNITIERIKKYGLYNSQLLTCAPTGSIGTMLQCSTGIEPVFAFSYNRTTKSLHGKDEVYKVYTKIVEDYKKATGNEELPSQFIESKDIAPLNRVLMQSVIQNFVDASISSTINLPESATIDEVEEIYMAAWKFGLKGVTVYRQGCQREGILNVEDKPKIVSESSAPKRPKTLVAENQVVVVKGEKYLISVGLLDEKPYELFITKLGRTVPKEWHFFGKIIKIAKKHYALESMYCCIDHLGHDSTPEIKTSALYISMLLRHGVDIKFIIKTSKKVNNLVTSLSAAITRVLSKYLPKEVTGDKCPECGEALINEGGCIHCPSCGWSKCS